MTSAASFRKLEHREHVLMRPDMYIGSVRTEPMAAWILADASCNNGGSSAKMERRQDVAYCPGLLKVFDEILVNAADHATRSRQLLLRADAKGDDDPLQVVKKIEVAIDAKSGVLEVANDGDGIPVEAHASGIYVPELIFGHLLTSANYDDEEAAADGGGEGGDDAKSEGSDKGGGKKAGGGGSGSKRTVGGQNGIGAKACNILSKWFEIEIVDRRRHLRYRQRWEDNMSKALPARIEKTTVKKSRTVVRWLPDYARFSSSAATAAATAAAANADASNNLLSPDMHALMARRVVDACAVTDPDVAVWLDGKKLEVKSFERYVELFPGVGAGNKAHERPCDGWEVAAAMLPHDGRDEGMQQVSFVNGVATLRGGRHVDHVVQQMCKKVCELIAARKKGVTPKPQYVRDNLIVFVRATVPGPTFDSQSKETLTTTPSHFGCKVEISNAFAEKLYKIDGLVERVVGLSGAAADKEAKKTDGSKRTTVVVPKLDDAEWAGTAKSSQCTLILTEGDSAKASAVAGLSVVGRQKYGVFPLRGKVMNVCDVGADKVAANAEITAIKKILGLQTGKAYASVADLRYGRVMLMTDADTDGSHIKGLVMNLFQLQWPSLLRVEGFMCTLLTPIVKAFLSSSGAKSKGGAAAPLEFYNLGEYRRWSESHAAAEVAGTGTGKKPTLKYYKGLGTSTAEEARDWFRKMKMTVYVWEEDGGRSKEALGLAFDKKRADDRKAWLAAYEPDRASLSAAASLGKTHTDVTYTEFVNDELIEFSNYDVLRSIPSAIDGLKVSQRKALFGCRKRNLVKGELRVAQLAAYVAEHACFHHGEASMQGTIVCMAQDYVGSGNNAPLLEPIGQFGTRLQGGSDWASPRYIHTRLSRLSTLLFPKEDDAVLEYLDDDGISIEPRNYLPILPLVLLNGATGIGTGYSTSVPSYEPLAVAAAVRSWISAAIGFGQSESGQQAAPPSALRPWYRGFRGAIEEHNGKLRSRGLVARSAPTKARVTELPLGVWTEDFKAALEALVEKSADVRSFANDSTDATVDFTITFATAAAADAWTSPGSQSASDASLTRLEAELKMTGTKGLATTNMHLFNARGQIQKFATTWAIVDAFCAARLGGYVRRREHILSRLAAEARVLRNKSRFLDLVADGSLALHDRSKTPDELAARMVELGLEPLGGCEKELDKENTDKGHDKGHEEDDGGDERGGAAGFKYLLSMPMSSLTARRKAALDASLASTTAESARVEATAPTDLWLADVAAFEAECALLSRP